MKWAAMGRAEDSGTQLGAESRQGNDLTRLDRGMLCTERAYGWPSPSSVGGSFQDVLDEVLHTVQTQRSAPPRTGGARWHGAPDLGMRAKTQPRL